MDLFLWKAVENYRALGEMHSQALS